MAALDGKITIERGLRPCVVRELCKVPLETGILKYGLNQNKVGERTIKSLFHCWNQVTGNAIVEYEDGTIYEVEPTQVRFVDNAMSEYVFPEDKGKKEKAFDALRGICPECGGNMRIDEGIVLTSNPPQYRLKCDKCGHIEYSGIRYLVSDNYE